MYNTLICDVDGTLINDDLQLDRQTREALLRVQHKGIRVLFCSGRMYGSLKRFLLREFGQMFPCISYNGAMIHFSQSPVPSRHWRVQPEVALDVVSFLEKRGAHVHLYVNDEIVTRQDNRWVRAYSVHSGMPYRVVRDFSAWMQKQNSGPTKLLAISSPPHVQQLLLEAQERFSGVLNVFTSFSTYLDFVPPGIHKGSGVEEMAKGLGFLLAQAIMVGDQQNDTFAFEKVGMPVAVGNADPEVQKAARYVAPDNNHRGVHHVLEKFFPQLL
ncbi:MAG TPA: Cof-type HAD-IIB family hydrolase [Thermotogota bacterium]|nr:Cof-type HAD-IIB family hydrolase [Thermotogota bacterium]HRW92966.1 Cof-type HAD-IIB family hydrolase [Thermotogota bacterium]